MSNEGIKKIFVTALDEVSSEDKEGIGVLRFAGNRIYKYCKVLNATATVALAAGDAVAYSAETGIEDNTVVGDLDDADTTPIAAGVVLGTYTGTAGTAEYGWVQIKGPYTVNQAITGTPGDGNGLAMGSADKTFARQNDAGAATVSVIRCGVINDASAKKVSLDCPF